MRRNLSGVWLLLFIVLTVHLDAEASWGASTMAGSVPAHKTLYAPAPNHAPVLLTPGPIIVPACSLLTVALSATDPDGDSLAYSVSGNPSGSRFDAATATFTWSPAADKAGQAFTFRFKVTDNGSPALIASELVTVTVGQPLNRPPVMPVLGPYTIKAGEPFSFDATSTDPDGDPLTYRLAGFPPSASGFDLSTARFTWTPKIAQGSEAGTLYRVRVEVADNGNPPLKTSQLVRITVLPKNRPPVIAPIEPQTVYYGSTLTFTVAASDPDGDAIAYSAPGRPSGSSIDPVTGKFTWTPTATQLTTNGGVFIPRFYATDNANPANSSSALVTLLVQTRPVVASPSFDPPEGIYTSIQAVSLYCRTPGAEIHFTTDGSPVTADSTLYTGTPIPVGSATTLKAVAIKAGMTDSATALAFYHVNMPDVGCTTAGDIKAINITPTVTMDFVCVTPGKFQMGGDNNPDEQPIHSVTLTNGFWIGRFEVTQAQWMAIAGNDNPSYFANYADSNDRPVEQVDWDDFKTWLATLNATTGMSFRLPTEAEWEFAARGGALSRGYLYSGSDDVDAVARYSYGPGYNGQTHPVGGLAPNELGLYDMGGNVSEWLEDDWHSSYGQANRPDDGTAWIDNPRSFYRVRRGGGWATGPEYAQVSYRSNRYVIGGNGMIGFRLALSQ